ncbi:hypothetical protein FRC03_002697 [Tulasnella sp. 419]|nr:hypothetical protein FRC03_002697 [Tulasnella sp. 419]
MVSNGNSQQSQGLTRARSRTRSRSPSFCESLQDDDHESMSRSVSPSTFSQQDSQRRQSSVDIKHERSRSRSASTFSLDLETRSGVSRGGVATNKSIFARQVDMHRSTKDLKSGKAKAATGTATGKSSVTAEPKRTFARSATAPIKPRELVVENPVTLVADTPIATRVRTGSPDSWIKESPDALLLESSLVSGRSRQAQLLIPETPIKGA